MAHYFTREEAESLLPQISIVLLQIQDHYQVMQQKEDELGALHAQAMGKGHHLHTRINKLQKELVLLIQIMQALVDEVSSFGCELKDPGIGLIDFLSLPYGVELCLCCR